MRINRFRMNWLAFILSAAMLLVTAARMATRLGRDDADRYWLFLAASVGQVGMISLGLSLIEQFAPAPFLLAQSAVLVVSIVLTPRKTLSLLPRPSLRTRLRESLRTITRSPIACVIALGIVFYIGTTLIEQFMMPVFDFDDRMYHASRAAYWMQHRSILDFATHNDRQVAFPLTGELMFGWPLMMTRSESIARFVFWLAYPLTALGVYLTLRSLRATAMLAMVGALVFCATPIVLYHTQTVHPDLWLALFCVGAAHFAARRQTIGLGVFAALALGTRAIALPLIVMVPIVALLARRFRFRGAGWSFAGLVLGLLLSGSLGVFVQNHLRDGTPLGSPQMRELHAADVSARQLHTHAVRAVLTLADIPWAPTERSRATLDAIKNGIAGALGAGEPLPRESAGDWPGPQFFATPPRSAGLSIAGWFTLPALVFVLIRGLVRRQLDDLTMIALLALPFWGATILLIRWMDGMPRFWIGPYAMGLVVLFALVNRGIQRVREGRERGEERESVRRKWVSHRALVGVAIILLGGMVGPSLYDRALTFRASMPNRQPPAWVFDDLREPLLHIPDGSRILLIAHADARDYAMFRPDRGFVNKVVPWGKSRLEIDRLRHVLSEGVSHVLIQDDEAVNLYWDGMLPTATFVSAMREADGWVEVPLQTPRMRLFSRRLDRF